MSTTAFGVRQSNDSVPVGTTANALRHILAAQWASKGVINGLKVTGTNSLNYNIAPGTAVCSKGSFDGNVLAYFDGGDDVTVTSNSSGNSRIDSIYLYSNDLDQGDIDNLVHVGVKSGIPATNPSAPSIPTYGTLLAQMLLPAGAQTTASASQASSIRYAIPYGASLGVLGYASNDITVNQNWDQTWYVQTSTNISLPTDRYIDVTFDYRAATIDGSISSMLFKLVVDNQDKTDGLDEQAIFLVWQRSRIIFSLNLPAGNHSVAIYAKGNTNQTQIRWEGIRRMTIYDRGVSI